MYSARRITDTIAASMRERHMSQRAAARRLGVSPAYLSRRFRGEVPFDLPTMLGLASLLEVELAELLDAASADVTAPHPSALAAATGAHASQGDA